MTSATQRVAANAGAGQPAAASPGASNNAAATTARISATDPRFNYEGRLDRSIPGAVGLVWQASRVAIDFEGQVPALLFSSARGANFYDVQLDDAPAVIVEIPEGTGQTINLEQRIGDAGTNASPSRAGRHRLRIAKRSEAHAGSAVFAGLQLNKGTKVFAPARPEYATRFEFFGDSITAGACNEDGAADQWESRRTHNALKSYAAFTADAFHADHRNIAVSGMGVSEGYVDIIAGQVWDRVYPAADAPKADLQSWQPDFVFVNYGENDTSHPATQGRPFPANFTDNYVAVVRAMRAAYPRAHVVLLRGGMSGCMQSPDMRPAWEEAVRRLEQGDPLMHHYTFQHYSSLHPRVADDQAMSDELVAWLKRFPELRKLTGT